MEKLAQFGVDPLLLGAQIVNFLLLVFILKRFLYKPVLELLKKREEKIKSGLDAGKKGEELLVHAKDEEKDILQKASVSAREMVDETVKRVSLVQEEMLEKARGEAEKVMQHAKEKILDDEEKASRELEGKVSVAAAAMLENIIPKVLTKNDHIRILESTQKMFERKVAINGNK